MPYTTIALVYLTLLVSLVIHEASHALFAKIGGDMTAYTGGQVTLNPLPHIRREPFGTVILPMIMLFSSGGAMCMGYAHIPVDPVWAYRFPKRAALMSAAGPLSNLVLAGIGFVAAKGLLTLDTTEIYQGHGAILPAVYPVPEARDGMLWPVCMVVSYLLVLNLLLFTLNLIPVPPLDGAGVVEGLFPRSAGRIIRELKRQPIVILIVMIGLLFSIMTIMTPIFRTVRGWL